MSKRYRKQSVAARYDCDVRSVDRMSKDGRLPPPEYLPGSRIPFWREEKLDETDRRATLKPQPCNADPAGFAQLLSEVSAAATPRKAKDIILSAGLKGELRLLSEAQLEALNDAIHEK